MKILASVALVVLSIAPSAWANVTPKHVISKKTAEATALKQFPGTVKEGELEKEKGRWIYSFDILGPDQKIHEVWVDAKTDKVVGHKIETPEQEAQEAKAEK